MENTDQLTEQMTRLRSAIAELPGGLDDLRAKHAEANDRVRSLQVSEVVDATQLNGALTEALADRSAVGLLIDDWRQRGAALRAEADAIGAKLRQAENAARSEFRRERLPALRLEYAERKAVLIETLIEAMALFSATEGIPPAMMTLDGYAGRQLDWNSLRRRVVARGNELRTEVGIGSDMGT